jgi:YD repeat-containing protein
MSSETDMDRSVFHYARKSYKYRGNLLTEERFINDTYLDKSGKKEVFVSRYAYDDKEKLLAIIRPGYETNLRYETTKDGEIRYSISGADTTEVLIKSNDRGLRKEVSITYPGVPLKSTVLSTTKVFNKDGEVMRRAKLISGKTERCETSYTYNGDKYIESEKCLQLGEHDDPPFSIERLTKYYDTGGQVVKELMESKAFNENSNPKAQYEKTFTYDEGGKLLIESNKNLKRKDARDEFITYTYNADGQLISNKRFQGEVIEGKEYAEESYDYEKGKLKVMRFSPKTAQMAYMFPPKHTIYLPNGKTERVITYDQQGKEAILLNLTYTRKGLCTNQRISEYGKLKVMLEYAYEFY